MKIRLISPVTNKDLVVSTSGGILPRLNASTQLSSVMLEEGPSSIESIFEESLAIPGVVKKTLEAEKSGIDAVVINCMNDPGLESAREAVSIPVVGPAQSSMLLASLLSHKFSVISTAARDVFPVELLVRRYGLSEKYTSTRWVNIPVLDLGLNEDNLVRALVDESINAFRQDGAHAIVFGCTGMHTVIEKVNSQLQLMNSPLIVIDPTIAALKWAEMLVSLGLSQSRRTYPSIKNSLLKEHQTTSNFPIPEKTGELVNHPKIKIIVPVVKGYRAEDWLVETQKGYQGYARVESVIHTEAIKSGPQTIETWYSKQMAIPEILRLAREAEKNGFNAAVIDCMSDPGLDASREAVSIPIIGPAQTSAFISASLGHRFSILGTRSDMGHKFETQMAEYGITPRLASVRTTGLSVQEVESNPDALISALIDAAEKAIIQNGAHVLIPGCTGMIGIASALREALLEKGLDVPVLEPPAAAIKMAELLSDLRLSHSKITFPLPPVKSIPGFTTLEITE
jgi:allantoin racemase